MLIDGRKNELEIRPLISTLTNMSTAEQIIHEIASLRPEKQTEVLEFVEFLKEKEKRNEEKRNEENALSQASLAAAMRGMEEEESLYTESDVIEKLG